MLRFWSQSGVGFLIQCILDHDQRHLVEFWKKQPANFNIIWLEWISYNSKTDFQIVWSRSSIFKFKSFSAQGCDFLRSNCLWKIFAWLIEDCREAIDWKEVNRTIKATAIRMTFFTMDRLSFLSASTKLDSFAFSIEADAHWARRQNFTQTPYKHNFS